MRTLSAFLFASFAIGTSAQTINQVGFSFDPPVLTVDVGQTITITLGSPHTCTEVSEETWNNNQNTPNGGFNYPAGTHELTLDVAGTYYYVCSPHANSGMKGQIIVLDGSGLNERSTEPTIGLFPNPASNNLSITSNEGNGRTITLIDAQGREALRTSVNGTSNIDISALEPGNYVVLLTNTNRTIIARERLTIAR